MAGKLRLDKLLVEKGLAETRARAQAMIMAGQVEMPGAVTPKPGTMVDPSVQVSVKEVNPYVSRGGLKLAAALESFPVSLEKKVCLDVGASTGGFTDCMLQHGAARVYALDVGHGQLHYKLRKDPRVVNMEGVNFRYFSCKSLKEPVEFVTIDVSFISLDKILPVVVQCVAKNGGILAMVKPQFEASPSEVKKGVVKDETLRQKTITKIKGLCTDLRLTLKGEMDSPVKGPQGNVEHFLWLQKEF
ncbi:MAG: TlyA family RNA methyltransferase [Endomicrobiales bacterium]